jgi:DNA replication protein DnaC
MLEMTDYLKQLHMSSIGRCYEQVADQARKSSWTYEHYLLEVIKNECETRLENRIARNLRNSKLPPSKTFDNFDTQRLPAKVSAHLSVLKNGSFLDRSENILAFGNPGSGKTHLVCAIGHELIAQDKRVFFTTCSQLVQDLLIAKRDLTLAKNLKKLSRFDAVIIDDIGYVQQSRQEMEVLFTFLADRYERGSIMITSNLPFSKWEQIFKDPMTTAAAIDRLVHHSVVLELNLSSYRLEQSKKKKTKKDQV